jgi:hypothetical protein
MTPEILHQIAATPSGLPTVLAAGQSLHSRYRPLSEAERYVQALNLGPDVRYLILIEPALGYTIPFLRERCPQGRILALYGNDFFRIPVPDIPDRFKADAAWFPGSGIPVRAFLQHQIPDVEGRRIGLVEWKPSQAVYGRAYLELLAAAAAFIRQSDANYRTSAAFGRRWFRNFFRNVAIVRQALIPLPISGPAAVIGAGPGLEGSLPLLRERRKGLFILAASAAFGALRSASVLPDLLVHTDGGLWALFHLYDAFRLSPPPPIALSLNAALPSQAVSTPVLLLSDGSLWQNLVLDALGLPFLSAPQRGTVSAAALDLAMTLGTGTVYLAGLDLGAPDIKTHAAPYALDRFLENGTDRLSPLYTRTFVQSRRSAASGSTDIYASWFRENLPSYAPRLRNLGKNHPLFDSLPPDEAVQTPASSRPWYRVRHLKSRPASAPRILLEALGDRRLGPQIAAELQPLLLPDRDDPSPEEIAWGVTHPPCPTSGLQWV